MPAYFLDTSALVKRYVAEIGSSWMIALTDTNAGNRCWGSDLARVEFLAALYRGVRTGTLARTDAQAAERTFASEQRTHFQLLAMTPDIITRAMNLVVANPLRANDAIQLATAHHLAMQSQALGLVAPVFISADQALNQIATTLGLSVDDPNLHP
jgi:predicted nucleic acid-binding protein